VPARDHGAGTAPVTHPTFSSCPVNENLNENLNAWVTDSADLDLDWP
jgi:hypothetical protein